MSFKVYAIPPVNVMSGDGSSILFAGGDQYEVQHLMGNYFSSEPVGGFAVIDAIGDERYPLWRGCAYLDGGDWEMLITNGDE